MLGRLRPPLPLTERTCRCRRILDPLGDHRAACSRAGVLRSRGGATGTCSRKGLSGSWSPCHNAHPPEPAQHPSHQPHGRPGDRSHREWPPPTCPCSEEFCNFFPAIFGICCQKLKSTPFAMGGDICFSRFSAPAYLWLQFAVAELLILAAPAIIRERLLRPFLRVMLLKLVTAKWERLREQWQSRFPLNPEDPSADSGLQARNCQLTYIIGFNLTALSRPGLTLLSILHVIYQIICSPWFLLIHSILSASLGKRSKQNSGHNAK